MTTHPIHGERTNHGIWFDESALQEPLEDPRQGINLLTCDVFPCDYSAIDALVSDNPIELTYNAEYGLWLCPTHWAELEALVWEWISFTVPNSRPIRRV